MVRETGEVRHNLMPGGAGGDQQGGKNEQPLPPPPTPTQWSHLYTPGLKHGQHMSSYTDNSSQYLPGSGSGNTYEVPHLPTNTTTLRYGYSGGYPAHPPSLASSHGIYPSNKHVVAGYYTDRPIV